MLAASQDIDNFIERQRSKLNKQRAREPANRQQQPANRQQQQQANRQQQPVNRQRQPAPAPLPPPPPLNDNFEDRLDVKVSRILDEPSPRGRSQQPYFSPSPLPPPFIRNSSIEQQQQQQSAPVSPFPDQELLHSSNDNDNSNPMTFFDRFGAHEERRAQLKDDLKREYNEYLSSLNRVSKSKLSSQDASPRSDTFGAHEERRAQLKDDLKREYNEYLNSLNRVSKSKLSSQNASPRNDTTRRVQFQQDGIVVAPWEKNGKTTARNGQNINNISSTSTSSSTSVSSRTTEHITNRSRTIQSQDEQYIRDREEYILELYEQIRELEARRRQLEFESGRLTTNNSTSVTRQHYAEDLTALNTLLNERLDQRSAIDLELARILNRPPVSTSPTPIIGSPVPSLNTTFNQTFDSSSQRNQQFNDNRQRQQIRNDNRSNNDGGFQIGREVDKEAEQATKKRYQQELQSQMRESHMRKTQEKQEKDEYERKLEMDIKRYYYFGRSGGGAPMRDNEGNVIATLGDLRNTQEKTELPRTQQPYTAFDDKIYSLGGTSSITNAPYYNGEQPIDSVRAGSPNHARGAVNNGIFGTIKTEEQLMREERYKQDLKRQIDEKRQRNAEEIARRRAEEERELSKHVEWQKQMEKQMAEETLRKQEKEAQERQQQQLQEELERQRQQEEVMLRRKTKRSEKTFSPRNDDNDADRQNTYDDEQQESPYRSISPPVPTIKNKDKKQTSNTNQQQPPINDNDDFIQPVDDTVDQIRQINRQPATKRPRALIHANPGIPIRTNSTISLRSDGSDSEVLNRLEHLKRQLKDKEARLHQHAKSETMLADIQENATTSYKPPSPSRKQSPGYLLNTTPRLHYRDLPATNDKLLRVLQTEDDEFKPSYFRDDSILMRGTGGLANSSDFISPSKRVDLSDGIFVTNIEDTARRRRFGHDPIGFYDRDDPTSMANLELNRIAEQNEHRLKKLRDLEKDDTSLLDSNEVLERFQQKQRMQGRNSQITIQDDTWLK